MWKIVEHLVSHLDNVLFQFVCTNGKNVVFALWAPALSQTSKKTTAEFDPNSKFAFCQLFGLRNRRFY